MLSNSNLTMTSLLKLCTFEFFILGILTTTLPASPLTSIPACICSYSVMIVVCIVYDTPLTLPWVGRRPTSPTTLAHWQRTPVWRCNDICCDVCYVPLSCAAPLMSSTGKLLVPPGLEPGTLRVWSVRDNHYTTGPDSTVHPWIITSHSPKYVPSPVDYPTILTVKVTVP